MAFWRKKKTFKEKAVEFLAQALYKAGELAVAGIKVGFAASVAHTTKKVADASTAAVVNTGASTVGAVHSNVVAFASRRAERLEDEELDEAV